MAFLCRDIVRSANRFTYGGSLQQLRLLARWILLPDGGVNIYPARTARNVERISAAPSRHTGRYDTVRQYPPDSLHALPVQGISNAACASTGISISFRCRASRKCSGIPTSRFSVNTASTAALRAHSSRLNPSALHLHRGRYREFLVEWARRETHHAEANSIRDAIDWRVVKLRLTDAPSNAPVHSPIGKPPSGNVLPQRHRLTSLFFSGCGAARSASNISMALIMHPSAPIRPG